MVLSREEDDHTRNYVQYVMCEVGKLVYKGKYIV